MRTNFNIPKPKIGNVPTNIPKRTPPVNNLANPFNQAKKGPGNFPSNSGVWVYLYVKDNVDDDQLLGADGGKEGI